MNPMRKGAQSATESMSSVVAMMQAPAASSFAVSQKFALEATRFWARRMRAYADQMELLARCMSPDQVVEAQKQFIERLQDDYKEESQAFTQLLKPSNGEERPNA